MPPEPGNMEMSPGSDYTGAPDKGISSFLGDTSELPQGTGRVQTASLWPSSTGPLTRARPESAPQAKTLSLKNRPLSHKDQECVSVCVVSLG